MADILVSAKPGTQLLLLGNEAIVRGALEAGVSFVSAYPGTPSSEICDTFSRIARDAGIYMEYSTNELVALEAAAGAALCGVKSMTSMKHVGLNVAADALMSLAYGKIKGGLVIVSADDPGCHSSQNEQDNRLYGQLSYLPILSPSDPQEAGQMAKEAFLVSESHQCPVILHTTTRVSHAASQIKIQPKPQPKLKGEFTKDMQHHVMLPLNARKNRKEIIQRLETLRSEHEKSWFNSLSGNSDFGILTSGVSYNYVLEALSSLKLKAKVLKIGTIHPLPEKLISKFLTGLKTALVVEELEPYLELNLRAIAKDANPKVKLLGKASKHIPLDGELNTRIVTEALAAIRKKKPPVDYSRRDALVRKITLLLPTRPPVMCPGCSHRSAYYAIQKATKKSAVYPGDIGCYTLSALPPQRAMDTCICMGASTGISCGASKVCGKPVIASVGDSTFMHGAIPGLINAVYNNAKFTLVLLDNTTTAMTGHQPHPGTGVAGGGRKTTMVMPEDVARGCGVKFVEVVDAFDTKKVQDVISRSLHHDGVSVVICRQECAYLLNRRRVKTREKIIPYKVNADKCIGCKHCINDFGCPAILLRGDKVYVDAMLCNGCGVCEQVCPVKAIGREQ
ncbi:MAG: indolepyruvate ferredoxin oxidoreductase subunit alpha [archaeon]